MKFINRTKEIDYLRHYFAQEPNSILFVYGPKSTGKSTLLKKVIGELNTKKYAINYLNLRNISIGNYQDFIGKFFPKSNAQKASEILGGLSLDIGFFKVGVEDEAFLKYDPFAFITKKLQKAKSKGIKPVLIIDEIQLLKDIYTNGSEYLINKLFNLFVALTKQDQIAHVILATSDSYFIDEIYRNASLAKTSEFFLVDHLTKEDVLKWLKEEQVSTKNAEMIWNYLGGSPWEIQEVLRRKTSANTYESICLEIIEVLSGALFNFQTFELDNKFNDLYQDISKQLIDHKIAVIANLNKPELGELIKIMVERDVWFYKAKTGEIIPNSTSVWWAIKKVVK